MAAITNKERRWRKWLLGRNLKWCPCCGQIKDITTFAKNRQTTDGLQSYCKECYAAIYYVDRDRRLEWQKQYAFEHANDVKHRNREHYQAHREERLNYSAQYYQENREAKLEADKRYKQTKRGRLARQTSMRRRRAREAQLPDDLTTKQWLAILQHFDYHCAYCGAKVDELHQEHFIPTSHGGGLTIGNIVPACPACNLSKKDTLPHNWAKDRGAERVLPGAIERIETYFAEIASHGALPG